MTRSSQSRAHNHRSRKPIDSRKSLLTTRERRQFRSTSNLPPVLVRGGASDKSVYFTKPGKSRRRLDVALPVPGAELRLPSLPVIRVGWRLLSGLLVLAILGCLYYLWSSTLFTVGAPVINGLRKVTTDEVNTVIRIEGEPIFTIDPTILHQEIQQAFPQMSAITVEVSLPATVTVSIHERVPVLTWRNGKEEIWVDSEGFSFPPQGENRGLVVLEGELPFTRTVTTKEEWPQIPPSLVAAILKINEQVPKKAHLIYDNAHGLGWKDTHGWLVYFGTDMTDIEMKLVMYKALLKRLNSNGVQPDFISVEYVHAPYYRVER